MPERGDIDTSVLQRLAGIRQQQAVLGQYAGRVEKAKAQVRAAVYRKVADDYLQRKAALEREAEPLVARATRDYQVLQLLRDEAATAHEAARFAAEEIELRHVAGEIDDQQFAERQREPRQTIERCESELAALASLDAEFRAALEIAEGETAPPALADVAEATVRRVPVPETPADAEMTVFNPPPVEAPEEDDSERTVFLLSGVLILEGGPEGRKEYVLGETNYIGRADDSHIKIVHHSVSRRHAVVTAGIDGVRIRDLDSQNGTSVNGKPVTEQALSDGDQILIGNVPLLFRSAAAASQ